MIGDSDPRFRRWLAGRVPQAVPADLLARSMTALEQSPAQTWRWPRLSLSIASGGVAVVAIAALLAGILGLLPPVLPLTGDASPSPTTAGFTSPGTEPTIGPSGSDIGSSEPGGSETPGATQPDGTVAPPTVPAPTPRYTYGGEPMTTVTFRLILTSVPADTISFDIALGGITTPPYINGLDDNNGATFCGGADRPARCVPGTYERQASFPTSMVPALEWFVDRWTTASTASNPPPAFSHGFVPADGLVVVRFPTPTPDPSATPAPTQFSCVAPAGQPVGIELRSWEPSYVSAENVCVTRIDVQSTDPHPSSGHVIVTVDGSVAWTMDLALWDSTGTQGTLPTYRIVLIDPPFALPKGHLLGLEFSGCDDACASTLDIYVLAHQP